MLHARFHMFFILRNRSGVHRIVLRNSTVVCSNRPGAALYRTTSLGSLFVSITNFFSSKLFPAGICIRITLPKPGTRRKLTPFQNLRALPWKIVRILWPAFLHPYSGAFSGYAICVHIYDSRMSTATKSCTSADFFYGLWDLFTFFLYISHSQHAGFVNFLNWQLGKWQPFELRPFYNSRAGDVFFWDTQKL